MAAGFATLLYRGNAPIVNSRCLHELGKSEAGGGRRVNKCPHAGPIVQYIFTYNDRLLRVNSRNYSLNLATVAVPPKAATPVSAAMLL